MALTEAQTERLRGIVIRMNREPSFSNLRRFITAESAEEQPDFQGLKRTIMEVIGLVLDTEIAAAVQLRKKERGEATTTTNAR